MVGSRTGMIRLLVVILTSLEGVFNFSTASETGVMRSLGAGGGVGGLGGRIVTLTFTGGRPVRGAAGGLSTYGT